MTPSSWETLALPLGFALDSVFGDPRGWPHPVRAIGWLIGRTERGLRAVLSLPVLSRHGRLEYPAGIVLLAVVAGSTGLAVWGLRFVASRAGWGALLLADSLLIYWGLAARSLAVESFWASEEPTIERARVELSMIVGRDTGSLDREEVCRACVETVAENCNDAVIAPLFWYAVGGPVALWVYKAINTLDSMVGYRNTRYRRLGWASARLDDVVGLVPARLTWILLGTAAIFAGENAGAAFRIGWRDGRKHPSPNAAWGEAAMAGALGIRLGGGASYGGVRSEKPGLGDPGDAIGPGTVRRAVRVMSGASTIAAAVAWGCRFWLAGRA